MKVHRTGGDLLLANDDVDFSVKVGFVCAIRETSQFLTTGCSHEAKPSNLKHSMHLLFWYFDTLYGRLHNCIYLLILLVFISRTITKGY